MSIRPLMHLVVAALFVSATACGGDDGDGDDDGGDTVVDSTPTNPSTFTAGERFQSDGDYVIVPASYDATHQTPMKLFVWLHGCGGYSLYDVANVSPAWNGEDQDWITLAPVGAENDCWALPAQADTVRTAIANLKTHFNIAPKQVILGGYSSGGDVSYYLAFEHASEFAGIAVTNTAPFKDSQVTLDDANAADWKINIYNLAHTEDEVYAIATVRTQVGQLEDAGFPATLEELPGTHYEAANAEGTTGTDADIRNYIVPKIDAGWVAP